MASRGRGRGRGGASKRTFNRDQLNALGVVGNETHPQISEPSPLFAPLLRSAAPLESSPNLDYALVLRQAFVNYVQLSYSYMKMPEQSKDEVQEKLEIPTKEMVYDLKMCPSELRPKLKAKRKVEIPKKEENVILKLEQLEKLETKSSYNIDNVKTEPDADDEDEEDENAMGEDEVEDEMDDGTDYGNNYFDNGDSYVNDEDDNLDDGPVY